MPKPKKRPYIAYGSNLNLVQMAHRCPTAKAVGTAALDGWQLLFRGSSGGAVATVERSPGSRVPVLIWALQPQDEAALDAYEGFPHLYRKETVQVKLRGKLVSAMIYIMNEAYPYGCPGVVYFNTIREGYFDAGFDVRGLYKAVKKSKEKGENAMNPTIKEQILAVRDTGETNMFAVNTVAQIAMREGYYELVDYLQDHKREYSRFVLTGSTQEG